MDRLQIADEAISTDIAGRVVWWELSGLTDADRWNGAVCEDARAPLASDKMRLERALRDAVGRSKEILIRPTKVGLALVRERQDQRNEYEQECSVWLNENDGVECSDTEHPLWPQIQESWATYRAALATRDVSVALCRAAKAMMAVPLRPAGGMYFIPASQLPQWDQLAATAQEVGAHNFFDLPCHTQATATKAVLAAIRAEAEEALRAQEVKISEKDRKMNSAGWRARNKDLLQLQDKLETYERALGSSLEDLRAKTKGLRREVAVNLLDEVEL